MGYRKRRRSGYAAPNGLEGKSDDEIRDAMGGTTAQNTFDPSGVPAVPESGQIAQTVLFNSTHKSVTEGSHE
jgi:hypothetical protein